MNQNTINKIYNTREGAALYEAGYRLHSDGNWRRTIDSGGCGLTDMEQEINRQGGVNHGSNTEAILNQEIWEARKLLDGYSDEEIEATRELWVTRDWLMNATR